MNTSTNFTAFKISIPVQVRFARQSGTAHTLEGPVHYRAGDALLTDTAGNTWPITDARFTQRYEPIPPTQAGQDGLYAKKRIMIEARKMAEPFTVALSNDRGTLQGKAGDYLIREPDGSSFIVDAAIFEHSYQRVEG